MICFNFSGDAVNSGTFSAFILHSIACPFIFRSSCLIERTLFEEIFICSLIRSNPNICSVMDAPLEF